MKVIRAIDKFGTPRQIGESNVAFINFDVLLTVHLSIILVMNQLLKKMRVL